MAEKITVKAQKRDTRGKNENRRLRAQGKIPVVIYGGGGESVAAAVNLSDLAAIIRTDSGANTVFSFDIDGVGATDVIFQDRQIDPIRGRMIHADLRRLVKGEKMEMTVPIHLDGEPDLSEDGAVLTQALRDVKVLCEPANAPDAIHVDVSGLTSDHAIHVSDLKVGPGIEIHEAPDTVVAAISVVREAALEPQLEVTEPEVIGGSGPEAEGGEGQ